MALTARELQRRALAKKAAPKKVAKKIAKKVAQKKASLKKVAKEVADKPKEKPTKVMVALEGFVDKKGIITFDILHIKKPNSLSDGSVFLTVTEYMGMLEKAFKKDSDAKKAAVQKPKISDNYNKGIPNRLHPFGKEVIKSIHKSKAKK